jgi:hypothetical protein
LNSPQPESRASSPIRQMTGRNLTTFMVAPSNVAGKAGQTNRPIASL